MWDFLSTLAWVGLVVYGLRRFGKDLRELLGRVVEIPGAKLVPPQRSVELEVAAKAAEQAEIVPPHPAVVEVVAGMRTKHKGDDAAALTDLAGTVVTAAAARLSDQIYGSQVQLLLDCRRRGTVPVEEARSFYDTAAKSNPALYGTYTFEQWLGWLLTSQLVRREGPNISPTSMGDALLVHRMWRELPIPPN